MILGYERSDIKYCPVKTPIEDQAGTRKLRGNTEREQVISHNTYIHRIVRVGVRPLVNTPVTPNQITAVRLVGGIVAAVAFAVGEPSWINAGAAIFVVSMFLDRADGELARLSGKTSAWGHKFDLISDSLANIFAFIGIGIGLRGGELGPWAPALGLIAGAAVAIVLWFVMRMENTDGERAGEVSGFAGFDPDDAMLVVPVVMVLGGGVPLLIAAAVGASAFALLFYILFRRSLKARSAARL